MIAQVWIPECWAAAQRCGADRAGIVARDALNMQSRMQHTVMDADSWFHHRTDHTCSDLMSFSRWRSATIRRNFCESNGCSFSMPKKPAMAHQPEALACMVVQSAWQTVFRTAAPGWPGDTSTQQNELVALGPQCAARHLCRFASLACRARFLHAAQHAAAMHSACLNPFEKHIRWRVL